MKESRKVRLEFGRRLVPALLLLVFLSPFVQPVYGLVPNRTLTQYLHRIWQTPQGLPPGDIRAIAQSTDGYMWLGTSQGLVRFDGVRFVSVKELGGITLGEVQVRDLWQDPAGPFWIATDGGGLLEYHDGIATRFSTTQGLPSDRVFCVVPGAHGVWACTGLGLARIEGEKVQPVAASAPRFAPINAAAFTPKDGRLWTGGDGADLSVWDGTRFSSYPLHSVHPSASVQALLAASDGALWVGTSDGLVRIHNGVEQRWTKSDGLANSSIFALTQTPDGAVWVGTNEGFSRIRDQEIETFGSRDGLSQSTVYSIFQDQEGDIWVGTKRGLNQFLDRRTIPFTTSEGLPANDTGPVLQDASGAVWVGTTSAGLARVEGRKIDVLSTRDGLSSDSIVALSPGTDGRLWVGTSSGLDLLAGGRRVERLTTANGLPSNSIRAVFRDSLGAIWIGTASGAAVYREGRVTKLAGSSGFAVSALTQDSNGRILAASVGGISVYDPKTLREIPAAHIEIRNPDAFFLDKQGLVWVGTLGDGLALVSGNRAIPFSIANGLFDDEIYSIVADDQDRLWMGCSKGIFSVNRPDLLAIAAGKSHKLESTPYSPMDGLQTVECRSGVQPGAWHLQDGHLSFSTIRGILIVNPSHLEMKYAPPPVVIEAILLDGRRASPAEIRDLGPGSRNVEFVYTGLSLRVPSRITFRYILEGFDKRWTDAGTRRQAFYTNLPHGDYRFRVIACNVDGTCNTVGASTAFTIPAAFYQRPWFLVLCVVLLAMFSRLAYTMRIQRIHRQFEAILGERSRIARELHDTLIQGFSGVTMQMQALAVRLSSEHRQILDDVIHDAAHCLTEARKSVADLRRHQPQISGLAAAIESATKQVPGIDSTQLRLHLDEVPRGLPDFVEHNLLRIAQESVSNSVRHSGAHAIRVTLRVKPESLRLSVQDNGCGFAPGRSGPGHYGLIGMRERAVEIGAKLDLTSQPGGGTHVSVVLPIRSASDGIRLRNLRQTLPVEN